MRDNFKVFVCEDYKLRIAEHMNDRDALVKEAALSYGFSNLELEDCDIHRTSKGKPYFSKLNIYFSVSHSDDLWTCLMGPSCCGLDVQYIKPCNFKKIAGRFFSKNEQKYIEEHGLEGFFDVWTMREAYGKYTGDGFWGKMPDFVHGGKLIEEANEVKFLHLDIEKGTKCVACIASEYDIQMIERMQYIV